MASSQNEALLSRLDMRTEDIVALTQDLIRIPTVNPPGENYRPCAELIGERLRARAVLHRRAKAPRVERSPLPAHR